MIDFTTLTLSAALSATCVLIATLASRPWRDASRWTGLIPIGIAVGWVASSVLVVEGELRLLDPGHGWTWLLWVSIPVLLLGVVELALGKTALATMNWLRWVLAIVFTIIAMTLLSVGRMTHPRGWEASDAVVWIALASVVAIATAGVSAWTARKCGPRPVLTAWAVASLLLTPALVLIASFNSGGNVAAMFSAGVGALLVVSIAFGRFEPGVGLWFALAIMQTSLITFATNTWYLRMDESVALILALAPLACLGAWLADRSSRWKPLAVVALATIALSAWPIGTMIDRYIELSEDNLAPY